MTKKYKNLLQMLATCLVAGGILTILAPYGTHNFSPAFRALYWVGLCVAGGLGAFAADVLAALFKLKLKPWQIVLSQSVLATLAVSTVIILTMPGPGLPDIKNIALILFYVWVIAAVISSIGALLTRALSKDRIVAERAALYDRLPPNLRSADIYALAAEDHYVRVITSRGDELILMRLSDAIKETVPLAGLSPHRSWWVAESGVDKVRKSEIILHNGQTIPISRNGMKQVREAGWK